MDDVIDLRSDNVTRPTPGMREAVAAAAVGDDQLHSRVPSRCRDRGCRDGDGPRQRPRPARLRLRSARHPRGGPSRRFARAVQACRRDHPRDRGLVIEPIQHDGLPFRVTVTSSKESQ